MRKYLYLAETTGGKHLFQLKISEMQVCYECESQVGLFKSHGGGRGTEGERKEWWWEGKERGEREKEDVEAEEEENEEKEEEEEEGG